MPTIFTTTHRDLDKISTVEWVSCTCCILMIVGLIFGRGLLSVGMIVLFVLALLPNHIATNWSLFKQSKFAILSCVFFGTYLLSGLWSENMSNWFSVIQIKLPFVFFPFAMIGLPFAKHRWLKTFIAGLIATLFAGMLYSFYFLILNFSDFIPGSHLKSPMEGDYIRFTITLVIALQCILYLLFRRKQYLLSKMQIGFLLGWGILAIFYIHIQAAKSGLVSFYLMAGIYIIYLFLKRKNMKLMLGILATLIVAAIGFSRLPSVTKQIDSVRFERKVFQQRDTSQYANAGSFVPRIISYKIATGIIKEFPLSGVGGGDVKDEMDRIYKQEYPNLGPGLRILPHNQFLCTALAIGLPLSIILILLVLSPLFEKIHRNSIYVLSNLVIMVFGLLIEPMLEVQFGIFVFLFFSMFWLQLIGSTEKKKTGGYQSLQSLS